MILLVECAGCGMIFNGADTFLDEVAQYKRLGITDLENMGFTCHTCTQDMEQAK